MAKVEVRCARTYVLTLTEKEAIALKNVLSSLPYDHLSIATKIYELLTPDKKSS